MIYVCVALRSARGAERDCILAEAEIANVGGTRTRGNYAYKLYGKNRRLMREGTVYGYARIGEHTWRLIVKVLLDAFLPGTK